MISPQCQQQWKQINSLLAVTHFNVINVSRTYTCIIINQTVRNPEQKNCIFRKQTKTRKLNRHKMKRGENSILSTHLLATIWLENALIKSASNLFYFKGFIIHENTKPLLRDKTHMYISPWFATWWIYICNYFAGKIRFITFPSNINQAIFSHLKLFPSCQLTQLMT